MHQSPGTVQGFWNGGGAVRILISNGGTYLAHFNYPRNPYTRISN